MNAHKIAVFYYYSKTVMDSLTELNYLTNNTIYLRKLTTAEN